MLLTTLLYILLMAFFILTGTVVLNAFKLNFNSFNLVAALLSGITLLALIGEWCAYFSLKANFFFLISTLVLVALSIMNALSNKKLSSLHPLQEIVLASRKSISSIVFPMVSALVFMVLYQGKWVGGQIAYRTGPDTFGWSDAIIFFRQNNSLAELKNQVKADLGNTPLFSALNVVHPKGSTAINQIPSFTKQIDAEFLLGAHRTGIPNLLGAISHFISTQLTLNLLVAFLMCSIFAMSNIVYSYVKNLKYPTWIALIGSLAVGLNCNLLFQSLEGGVGELYSIPFLLFSLVLCVEIGTQLTKISFSLGILVVIAISSYFDILFTAIPILGGLIMYCVFIGKEYRLFDLLKNFRVWILLIISFIPFASSFIRLAITPFIHPTSGGWDIGRNPLLTNIFGIISNLPSGSGRLSGQRQGVLLGFELLASAGLVVFLACRRKEKLRFLLIQLLLFYAYLYYSVYSQQRPYNNYRLWKYAAIASCIFPIILLHSKERLHYVKKKSQKKQSTKKDNLANLKVNKSFLQRHDGFISTCVLITIVISSIVWMQDWQQTKKLTLDKTEARFISDKADNYDFIIDGSVYGAMITLYGDIHYASPQRGPVGFLTKFSNPVRPILFLANKDCKGSNCLPGLPSYYPKRLVVSRSNPFPNFVAVSTTFTD